MADGEAARLAQLGERELQRGLVGRAAGVGRVLVQLVHGARAALAGRRGGSPAAGRAWRLAWQRGVVHPGAIVGVEAERGERHVRRVELKHLMRIDNDDPEAQAFTEVQMAMRDTTCDRPVPDGALL